MTRASYISNVVTAATGRGVTDPDALASIRREAIDTWQSYLNTYTGVPLNGSGTDCGH
jgi:hypothetical protein